MKKIIKIFVLTLLLVLGISSCDSNKKGDNNYDGSKYELTIIDENNFIFDKPSKTSFAAGTELKFHSHIIYDVDLAMYVDGEFEKIQYNVILNGEEVFEFKFTMPSHNTTLEFKVKSGPIIDPSISLWLDSDKELMTTYLNGKILPYIENNEYQIGYDNGYFYLSALIENKEYNDIYFAKLQTLLGNGEKLTDSEGDYYIFDLGNNIELGYAFYESDTYEIYIWAYENITPSYDEYLNQDDFTSNDKLLFSSLLSKSLPFAKCYEYGCELDEDEYGEYVMIQFTTSEQEASKYLDALKAIFKYDYDNGDIYFGDGNTMIEYYDETNDSYHYITMFIYDWEEPVFDDDAGGDDPITPVTGDGLVISPKTMTKLTTTYNTSIANCSINGVNFSYTYMALADNYTPAAKGSIQHKKTNTIYNTTPIENVTVLTVTYTYGTGRYTVSGGNSAKNLDITATSKEVSGGKSGQTIIQYSFATPVSYIELKANGACYFNQIVINGETVPGGSDVTIEDDGNGYKNIDFTKATYSNATDFPFLEDGCPTTGNINILVIPVEFSDCTAASKGYTIDILKQAFNGPSDQRFNNFVSNYFYNSSYGKLNINFDVLDNWYMAKKTASSYNQDFKTYSSYPTDIWGYDGSDSYATCEMEIINDALKDLDNTIDFSKYDNNNDGSIDGIVLVYTHDYDVEDDGSLWWAWQYYNYLADINNPYFDGGVQDGYDYFYYDDCYANAYLWASYQFLFEDADDGCFNVYTFCHELSHVLGAEDYYDYNGEYHPLNGFDIMDDSYCDHTAFTKAYLGWIDNARLVTTTDKVTLTLNSIQKQGDFIILANSFDDLDGLFQEYYIIEFYTKDGGLFDESGIIVHHVNAELAIDEEGAYLKNDNSSGEDSSDDNLYELIENGSSYLFKVGDTFTNATLDDGSLLGFSFKVDSIEGNQATITFTRNK